MVMLLLENAQRQARRVIPIARTATGIQNCGSVRMAFSKRALKCAASFPAQSI